MGVPPSGVRQGTKIDVHRCLGHRVIGGRWGGRLGGLTLSMICKSESRNPSAYFYYYQLLHILFILYIIILIIIATIRYIYIDVTTATTITTTYVVGLLQSRGSLLGLRVLASEPTPGKAT